MFLLSISHDKTHKTPPVEKNLGYIDTFGSTKRLILKSQGNTIYRLIDEKTGQVIKNQILLVSGKKLQVVVDKTIVLEIDNFFGDKGEPVDATQDPPQYVVDTGVNESNYGLINADAAIYKSENNLDVAWMPGLQATTPYDPQAFGVETIAALSSNLVPNLLIGGSAVGLAATASSGKGDNSAGSQQIASNPQIKGNIYAGQVTDNGNGDLTVEAFDATGTSLGKAKVNKDGSYELTLNKSHKGMLVLKVYDANTSNTNTPQHLDEATFVWNAGDAVVNSVDVIKDFSAWNGTRGDKLDIRNLLTGYTSGTSTLSQWVSITNNSTIDRPSGVSSPNTKIVIDIDGAGSGTTTQTIWLDGVSGLSNDPTILKNSLILIA